MTKDRIVSARFTKAEHEQLSRMADRLGVPLSTLLRRAALRELHPPAPFATPAPSVTTGSRVNIIWNYA